MSFARRGVPEAVTGAVLIFVIAPICFFFAVRGSWATESSDSHMVEVQRGSTYHATKGDTLIIDVLPSRAPSERPSKGSGPNGEANTCRVTSPNGTRTVLHLENEGPTRIDLDRSPSDPPGEFTAKQTGDYTITCAEGNAIVLPWSSLTDRVDTMDDEFDDDIKRMFTGIGIAGVVFVLGVVLLIVGLVRIARSGREERE